MTSEKSCCCANFHRVDGRAAGSEKHRQRLAIAGGTRRPQLAPGEGFSCSPDCIEGIGLRTVAARDTLRPVELNDQLLSNAKPASETGAVAACALDSPGPAPRVHVSERDKLLVALGRRLDGQLAEDAASPRIDGGGAVRHDVGVDADHDVDNLGQTVHAFLLARRDVVGSGPDGDRQDCDGTRPRSTPRRSSA